MTEKGSQVRKGSTTDPLTDEEVPGEVENLEAVSYRL